MTTADPAVTPSSTPPATPHASPGQPPLPGAATSRAVIDLEAVAHNGRRLAQVAGVPWMAVVKADAYGHGLGPVALTALSAGASWLGAAQVAEALRLRSLLDQAGVARPAGEATSRAPRVLAWLLPVMDPARAAAEDSPLRAALAADLDLSVSAPYQLDALVSAARAQGTTARLHLKVDTGMSRGGAMEEDLPALAAALRGAADEGTVDVVGLWSHLSRADEPGSGSTQEHLERFRRAEQIVREAGLKASIHHLAATAGLLWHPDTRMDLVRVGIGLYGLSPDPSVATCAELGLRPAMRLESALIQVKRIDAGQAVSYGGTWRAPTDRWVGLIPLGYSDGVPRAAGSVGPVGVAGIRTSVVGRVCMDQIVVDLGPARDGSGAPLPAFAAVGDTAVLWGAPEPPGRETIPTADEWALACGTINYEIVTRLGPRIPRCYVGAPHTSETVDAVAEATAAEITVATAGADDTRDLGARLARLLRGGDLVMLSGELGAGKTTLAQGVGTALGVRGRVSSPTFIIARVHPSLVGGPDLVHVDAYRITSLEEVDALDLDSSLDRSVTLVEWGRGKVETLSPNRLEIEVVRLHGAAPAAGAREPDDAPAASGAPAPSACPTPRTQAVDLGEVDDGRRLITVRALGPRWAGTDLGPLVVDTSHRSGASQ